MAQRVAEVVHFDLTTYSLYLFSSVPAPNRNEPLARIYCRDGDGSHQACLTFWDDHIQPPRPASDENNVYLHYNLSQFHVIMEMLRIEKPVRVTFNPNSEWGNIHTGSEPVGEEELGSPG